MNPDVIAPRLTPPAPSSGSGKSVRLPDDIVQEQIRRVSLFTAVSAFMWGFGMLMDGVVMPVVVGKGAAAADLIVEGIAVGTTLALLAVLRYAPIEPRKKVDCGLWLTLLNCFGTSAIDTWLTGAGLHMLGGPSWTTTVILASAMIMPNTPRKTLLASLAAAAMGPIGVWVAHLRGFDTPAAVPTLLMFIPDFLWAGVAALSTAMFQRMGKRINEARALGSYELVEQLGAGGMGSVWRARHRFLARDAAVKLVKLEALGDTDSEAQSQLRRFEREAQATALLRSQHSIRLFDFGTADDGSFYYVMELLEGRDLEHVVKDFGPMAPERVTFLLKQICHSLAEAHARGMVHRDIKPANIFLCRMGLEFDFVKVLDFGLVQTRKPDASTVVTETLATSQKLIGTPAYMAPEVILGKDDVDRRADVYAIGCVAFYLLTGTRVFQDGNQMQALVDHVHTDPVSPSTRLGRPLPKELDRLVLDCLRKKPDDRPQDAAELLDRLVAANVTGAWSNGHARVWWESRLPELAGPLVTH